MKRKIISLFLCGLTVFAYENDEKICKDEDLNYQQYAQILNRKITAIEAATQHLLDKYKTGSVLQFPRAEYKALMQEIDALFKTINSASTTDPEWDALSFQLLQNLLNLTILNPPPGSL